MGHAQDVERLVQLLLGQPAVSHIAALDDDIANGLVLDESLLGDLRRLLVADVSVQRRNDGGRALRVSAHPNLVRGDAVHESLREET